MPHLAVVVNLGKLAILDILRPLSVREMLVNNIAKTYPILQSRLNILPFLSSVRGGADSFVDVVKRERKVRRSSHKFIVFALARG